MTAELRWGRRYLMCPPAHFDVSYAINPWMDLAVPVDSRRAQRQWDALVEALGDAGAAIDVLEPAPDLPDLVFTANLGLVDGRRFLPSRMRHAQRRPEVDHAAPWFRARGFEIRPLDADVIHEGAGDALPFGPTLVGGYRTRSSASAYVDLARLVPGPILPVELIDERFYHLDLVFCPLDDACAMAVPDALDSASARLLRKLVPDLIELTEEEAGSFCANSIVVGRTLMMPACPPRLARELHSRGFEPVVLDVSEFLKAGGGPRCLTLALDVRLSREPAGVRDGEPAGTRAAAGVDEMPADARAAVAREGEAAEVRAAGGRGVGLAAQGTRPFEGDGSGALDSDGTGALDEDEDGDGEGAGDGTGQLRARDEHASAGQVPARDAHASRAGDIPARDGHSSGGRTAGEANDERHVARTYDPLPVTITHAEGAWVRDDRGRRYFDALSAYSALNFGHRHPRLVLAARDQLDRVTLTSRAFGNDQLGAFARELAAFCGKDRVLPMNSGAEGVESAIKTARKWGYKVKGVAPDQATIVVCHGNFHGRTTTIVSFSDDPVARADFGPFTPGFRSVAFGDFHALDAVLDDSVVAFLVEPVQGEAGVIVPPDGYLRAVRRLCSERGVLLIADEIQSGLGRTGRTFACDHEAVEPDLYVLGKALGGGIMPLSAVVGNDDVLGVLRAGEHGSTFGGNPLACAIGRAVIELLDSGEPQANAARLGRRIRAGLEAAAPGAVREIRSRGLWFGVELAPEAGSARWACERLLDAGVLAKETHERTVRLSPPLIISEPEADWLLERVVGVFQTLRTPVSDRPAADRPADGARAPAGEAGVGSAPFPSAPRG